MPNDDYIKRSDALKAILGVSIYDTIEELEGARTIAENTWADGLYDAYIIIEEEVDAADVEPKRKTGQWLDVYVSNPARMRTMCSECGLFSGIGGIPSNRHKPYCPNCGSPMLPEPPKEEDDGADMAL